MSLKQCCATGSLHTGTPTGRTAKLHGLDCYIADAPSNKPPTGIWLTYFLSIIIIPDAFGWELPNNRTLADEYAKRGFQVYLPEFMQGWNIPHDMMFSIKAMSATGFWNQVYKFGHAAYLARHFAPFMLYNRPKVAGPRVWDFVKAVKENEGRDLPMGAAGFCWGGHFVTQLCKDQVKTDDGRRLIVCGFVAHPSFLTYPDDIEGIVLPYSCAAAELEDPQMSPEQAKQTREILEAKTETQRAQGIEHEFVMYNGARHGFAVRADEEDKHEAAQGEKAEEQAVRWFTRWFETPPPAMA